MEVIIIFGPPGSGKGTQADLFVKNLGYEHLSTGDLLRKEIASGSMLGKEIKGLTNKGKLVSDKIVNGLVEEFLKAKVEDTEGVILDGYPRTVFQARVLDKMFEELDISNIKIVNLLADEDELCKRLLNRAKIEGRKDDNEETILERFKIYNSETFPVLDYYENTGAEVFNVDAIGEIEKIHEEVIKVLR